MIVCIRHTTTDHHHQHKRSPYEALICLVQTTQYQQKQWNGSPLKEMDDFIFFCIGRLAARMSGNR